MWPKLSDVVVCGLVFCLGLAQAQLPFPGVCPEVKLSEDFNLDAYMGIWYENSKYPFVFEVGKRCMYARYENLGNNTVGVMNAAVNIFTGVSSNVTGYAKVLGPAQLAVVFSEKQNPDHANYLVLGTDYTSYAVVYSCQNMTRMLHSKIVWILTRERKPSQDVVDAARKVMDANNLQQVFLISTTQDNCPEMGDAADAAASNNSIGSAETPELSLDAATIAQQTAQMINRA